jgi:hypothetical protein
VIVHFTARGQTRAEAGRLVEGAGTREIGAQPEWSGVQKCNLVAQSQGSIQRGISVRGRKRANRTGHRPHELIYFKVYKSQIPIIEQAIETAAMMLGSDKSRGYATHAQS